MITLVVEHAAIVEHTIVVERTVVVRHTVILEHAAEIAFKRTDQLVLNKTTNE